MIITEHSCQSKLDIAINIAILRLFAKNSGGADIVSEGELFAAFKSDIPPKKIVYAGVGKTDDEINRK